GHGAGNAAAVGARGWRRLEPRPRADPERRQTAVGEAAPAARGREAEDLDPGQPALRVCRRRQSHAETGGLPPAEGEGRGAGFRRGNLEDASGSAGRGAAELEVGELAQADGSLRHVGAGGPETWGGAEGRRGGGREAARRRPAEDQKTQGRRDRVLADKVAGSAFAAHRSSPPMPRANHVPAPETSPSGL